MAKTVTYRCPKCKMEAEIKGNSKRVRHKVSPETAVQSFPSHRDCELAKPIKKMDLTKLIKVREG